MIKAIWAVLCGLVAGAIIHIVAILAIPNFATADIWTQLKEISPQGQLVLLPSMTPQTRSNLDHDPAMEMAVCRYDLQDGYLRINFTPSTDFWSASIFNRFGGHLYSFNDSDISTLRVELIIITEEMAANRDNVSAVARRDEILFKVKKNRGFITFRLFAPSESTRKQARLELMQANCQHIQKT